MLVCDEKDPPRTDIYNMAARQVKAVGVIVRWVQRVDGFVSANSGDDEGLLRTSVVKVSGRKLKLNLDTGALGELRVGLTDASGKAIDGFRVDQCGSGQTNATGATIAWAADADLAALQGREVRLEFRSRRTKLYSFRFE